jgi:cysteinyl-tRNA synthetase
MMARSAGKPANCAAPTSRSTDQPESEHLSGHSGLPAYRATLTRDLLARTRAWLREAELPDLTLGSRLDLVGTNIGEVLIDGQPVSEPGDDYSLDRIQARGFDLAALRYYGLTAHYATPWCFSWTGLASAQCALGTLLAHTCRLAAGDRSPAQRSSRADELRERFGRALADDLDTTSALDVCWQLLHEDLAAAERRDLLLDLDRVLGLDIVGSVAPATEALPEGARPLIEARTAARQHKDWSRADELREALAAMNVETRDGPTESVYRWIPTS